jgi:uncharacterized protein YybS (DUF2232 family)
MTKDILSGIAITSFIFVVSMNMPLLGFFSALFIPLPVLFYRSKLDRNTGAIIPIATFIIMMVVIGGITSDVIFFAELLFIGFVMGELLGINLSVEKTVLYTCGAVFITGIFGLFFYSNTSGTGFSVLVTDYVSKNLDLTIALYKSMGMPEENIRIITDSREQIEYVLARIIPALVAVSTLFVVWTNLIIAKPIFKLKGIFYPDFGNLNQWRAPEYLVWAVIGSGLSLLLPDMAIKMVGVNILMVLMPVYFFQGIAIVTYFFEKKKIPFLLRIFLYTLIALQQLFLLMVIAMGFFDMWMNFRKMNKNSSS